MDVISSPIDLRAVDKIIIESAEACSGKTTMLIHLLQRWQCSEATVVTLDDYKVRRQVCIDDNKLLRLLEPNIALLERIGHRRIIAETTSLGEADCLDNRLLYLFPYPRTRTQKCSARRRLQKYAWIDRTDLFESDVPKRFTFVVVNNVTRTIGLWRVPTDSIGQSVCFLPTCPTPASLNALFCGMHALFGANAYLYFWVWEFYVDKRHRNAEHNKSDRRCAALAIPYLQRLIDTISSRQ